MQYIKTFRTEYEFYTFREPRYIIYKSGGVVQ